MRDAARRDEPRRRPAGETEKRGKGQIRASRRRTGRIQIYLVIFVVLIIVLVVSVLIIVVLVVVFRVVVLDAESGLLLPLHPPLGELLHHFEELLTIVLEEVVGDGEDTSWAWK